MKKTIINKILIIDDEANMLHMLSAYLRKEGYDVITTTSGQEGLELLARTPFNFILCDLKMPKMDGLQFLKKLNNKNIEVTVIMMSAFASVDTAVQAMKMGAYDFITKPFKIDEIHLMLQKATERALLKQENRRLQEKVDLLEGDMSFRTILGESQPIKKTIELAQKVAKFDTTVLITGESGTGKELIAKGIHNCSKRSNYNLIVVNCGSIPANLLESEFFGYIKGAFTGADKDHSGLFEAAEGGTIFLDEIGELPLSLQVKLLRVLQEQEIKPVGGSVQKKIDVRVLAATAKDLKREVQEGTFRSDLLFRLNVVEIQLPTLKERREDILILAQYFIDKFSHKFDCQIESISSRAKILLMRYCWPGNVRELENVIQRGVIYAINNVISTESLPDYLQGAASTPENSSLNDTCSLKEGKIIMERHLINKALALTDGNKSRAAQLLEISYPSLLSKIKTIDGL